MLPGQIEQAVRNEAWGSGPGQSNLPGNPGEKVKIPEQQGMENFLKLNEETRWKNIYMNIPGLSLQTGGDLYEYKLPLTYQKVGFCSRKSRFLYLCDLCCPCLPQLKLNFNDYVSQKDGDQIRYRSIAAPCCFPMKILTYRSGNLVGGVGRPFRCCNKCKTCMEDCRGADVTQIQFRDPEKRPIARILRNGRGCCIECQCSTPMKCINGIFICVSARFACRPSKDKNLQPIIETLLGQPPDCLGMTQCCLDNMQDPVMCEGCVRKATMPDTCCRQEDIPILGCGIPIGSGWACWCPCATTKHVPLPPIRTIKLEEYRVVGPASKDEIGRAQMQFRTGGEFGAMRWLNGEQSAIVAGIKANSPIVGMLASSVIAGRSRHFGDVVCGMPNKPPFQKADLIPNPDGRSPDFAGWVTCGRASQVRAMLDALGADMIVREDIVLGDHINGYQVQGWKLTTMGFMAAPTYNCYLPASKSGLILKPTAVRTKSAAENLYNVGTEKAHSDFSTEFTLQFELPDTQDPFPIVKAPNTKGKGKEFKFDPASGGFSIPPMDTVYLSCVNRRVWALGGKGKVDIPICQCPIYLSPSENAEDKEYSKAPVQVLMKFST